MSTHQTKFCDVLDSIQPGQHYLAIVFTDIKGFSKRVEREEKLYRLHAAVRLKEEHDALLREYLDDNSYVKSLGDGCLFLFRDTCAPIPRAIDLQNAFKKRYKSEPPDQCMEIRIGIHSGNVYFHAGTALNKWNSDPLSDAVNLASRVMDTAPAGTIHISNEAHKRCRSTVPSCGKLTDLGLIKLHGREESCHIWQINPCGGFIRPDLSKHPQADSPTPSSSLIPPARSRPHVWWMDALKVAGGFLAGAAVGSLTYGPKGEPPSGSNNDWESIEYII